MGFFSDIANLTDQPDSRGMTFLHCSGPDISKRSKDLPGQTGATRIKEQKSQTSSKAVQNRGHSTNQELQVSQFANTPLGKAEGIIHLDQGISNLNEADTKPGTPIAEGHSPRSAKSRRKGENPENFKAAWPWLKANCELLLATGWTKAELFQRGRFRCPLGKWGVAWLDVWRKEDLSVSIVTRGQIVFKYANNNRMIQQSAFPIYSKLI